MKTQFNLSQIKFSYIMHSDLKDLVCMLKKPAVCKQVFFGPNSEEETHAYFMPIIESIAASIQKNEMPDNHVFIMRKEKELIGNCALLPVAYSPGNYIIGYTIDDQHWKKGYGSLACQFLVDYGFNQLNAYRLSGDCMSQNPGSKRIMEKNGFLLEGRQVKYWFKNGQYYDNLLFGLVK